LIRKVKLEETMSWSSERWYWRTFWTVVIAVVVAGFMVWLVDSRTGVGSNTASNEAPAIPPAVQQRPTPGTP
jgi:hypothetical protein